MIEALVPIANYASMFMEILGIFMIVVFGVNALALGVIGVFHHERREVLFDRMRQRLGRGILIGLEYMVAGDIIHTVAIEFTLRTVSVLAIIVLIRTFLSYTLEVELTGCWPWKING